MPRSPGMSAALFLFVTAVVVGTIGGLGYFDAVGMEIAPGVSDDADDVAGDVGTQGQTGGSGTTSFITFLTGAADTLGVFWALITQTAQVAEAFGVDPEIAQGLQTMTRVLFGLFVVGVLAQRRLAE